MNLEDTSKVVMRELTAALASYGTPVHVLDENRINVDLSNPPDLYIEQRLEFGPAAQIFMGDDAVVRTPGALTLIFSLRTGTGTREARKLMDHLSDHFQLRSFTDAGDPLAVQFLARAIQGPLAADGRHWMTLSLPFMTDVIVST